MTGAEVIVASTIIATIVGITALWIQLSERSRAQAGALEKMKQDLRAEGKASMQPMIELLTSQRDDARAQLRDARAENTQLREWLHDRPGSGSV